MFLRSILLVVSSVSFLSDFHVSSCDANCADKPVFTPSSLVVKFGDPTSAKCRVCQSACPENLFGLERSVGNHSTEGPIISWVVDRMTEWNTSPMCYYNANADKKCCSILPVTVYKPPDSVSISFDNSEPVVEGHQYTLQCKVHNVAPVRNLTVTFYRGKTPLGPPLSKTTPQKEQVTETYSVNIIPSKADDGVKYWCEAKLELGPGGPQPSPVVKSPHITASVNSNAITLIPRLSICFTLSLLSLF